jgi:hypothetical protein
MAKNPMRCPFSNKLCTECAVYRGRHYYMCTNKKYRGYIKPNNEIIFNHESSMFNQEAVTGLLEPWSTMNISDDRNSPEPKIKIKKINMENDEVSICHYSEVKAWRWEDPTIIRVVNGYHVTSWNILYKIMNYFERKGIVDLVVYEGPRFMIIAGG